MTQDEDRMQYDVVAMATLLQNVAKLHIAFAAIPQVQEALKRIPEKDHAGAAITAFIAVVCKIASHAGVSEDMLQEAVSRGYTAAQLQVQKPTLQLVFVSPRS